MQLCDIVFCVIIAKVLIDQRDIRLIRNIIDILNNIFSSFLSLFHIRETFLVKGIWHF